MLLMRAVAVVVIIGLVAGAWQIAYARGRDDGRTEGAAIRNEFVQARQGGSAVSGGPPGGSGATGGPAAAEPAGSPVAKPGGGGRQGVNGTIEKVENGVLTVATSEGSVQVMLNERTRISKQVAVAPAELKPGERIAVFGERRSDREYTASAIQVQGQ
jgi:hypothetical protein